MKRHAESVREMSITAATPVRASIEAGA